jgi:hypothetical protein
MYILLVHILFFGSLKISLSATTADDPSASPNPNPNSNINNTAAASAQVNQLVTPTSHTTAARNNHRPGQLHPAPLNLILLYILLLGLQLLNCITAHHAFILLLVGVLSIVVPCLDRSAHAGAQLGDDEKGEGGGGEGDGLEWSNGGVGDGDEIVEAVMAERWDCRPWKPRFSGGMMEEVVVDADSGGRLRRSLLREERNESGLATPWNGMNAFQRFVD